MLSAYICRGSTFVGKMSPLGNVAILKQIGSRCNTRAASTAPRKVTHYLKEKLMSSFRNRGSKLDKSVVIGASALGLGTLCYYGLALSQSGPAEGLTLWPEYVKERIKETYLYIGGSLAIAAGSAIVCIRMPVVANAMIRHPWLSVSGTMSSLVATSYLVHNIPYEEGLGAKQVAWFLHSLIIGAAIAPPCLLGGPAIMRAALYTAGIMGGLSAVVACTPSSTFLDYGTPLAIGFGVALAGALGGFFLSPNTNLGAGLYAIAIYGGLILFSAFLLAHTRRVVQNAEVHPPLIEKPYDPVNASIGIYADMANIVVRILQYIAGYNKPTRTET